MAEDPREIKVAYTGGAQAFTNATTTTQIKRLHAQEVTTTGVDTDANTVTATVYALPVFDMGPGGTGGGGGVSDPVIRTATTTTNLYVFSNAWTGTNQAAAAVWMDSRVTRDTAGDTVVAVSVAAGGAGGGNVTIASPTQTVSFAKQTGAAITDTATFTERAVVMMGPNTTVAEGGSTFHAHMNMVTVSKIPTQEGAANLFISPNQPAATKARVAVHFDPLFTGATGGTSVVLVSDVNMGAGGGGTDIAHTRQSGTDRLFVNTVPPLSTAAMLGAWMDPRVTTNTGATTGINVSAVNTLAAQLATNTDSTAPWVFSDTTAGTDAAAQMALDVWARVQSNTVSDYAYVGNASPLGASVQPRLAVWCRQDVNQNFTVTVTGGAVTANQIGPWNLTQLGRIQTTNNTGDYLHVQATPFGELATGQAALAAWMDSRASTFYQTITQDFGGTGTHIVTKIAMLVSDLAGGGAGGTDIHLAAQSNQTAAYVSHSAWTNTTVAAIGAWMDSRVTSDMAGNTSTVVKVQQQGAVRVTNLVASQLGVSAFGAISRAAETTIQNTSFGHAGAAASTLTAAGSNVSCANSAIFHLFVSITGAGAPGPIFLVPQVSANGTWNDYDFGYWKQLGYPSGLATAGIRKALRVPALGDVCRVLLSAESVNSSDKYSATLVAQAQNVQ